MQLTLLNKRNGFSLIETLLAALFISLLMAGAFYLLNATETLRSVTTARTETQSEVRRAMDWIVNDIRQTVNWSIGSKTNNPLSTHIKFQKVTGYNSAGAGSPIFGGFVEYTYDPSSKTITRTDLSTNQNRIFNNIISDPFYTRKLDNTVVVIDPVNTGDDSPVFSTGNLVVVIAGQKKASTGLNVNYTLTEQVKLRN